MGGVVVGTLMGSRNQSVTVIAYNQDRWGVATLIFRWASLRDVTPPVQPLDFLPAKGKPLNASKVADSDRSTRVCSSLTPIQHPGDRDTGTGPLSRFDTSWEARTNEL